MSALEPITVKLDALPEPHRFEIQRLEALSWEHGKEHKKLGMQDTCYICHQIIRQSKLVADGNDTAMILATEETAKRLAEQMPVTDTRRDWAWKHNLTEEGRNDYRQRAVTLLIALDDVLGTGLPVRSRL